MTFINRIHRFHIDRTLSIKVILLTFRSFKMNAILIMGDIETIQYIIFLFTQPMI